MLVKGGTFTRLNPDKRPGSFYCRSHPDDVARSEERTFISSLRREDAGPTNNWKSPAEMKAKLTGLFRGCMRGRTLYVIPFSMGPLGSDIARIGVQFTDSRLRGREHAHHDAHGRRGPEGIGRRRFREVPALRGHARWNRAPRTRPGRAIRPKSTSSISPRNDRSGPSAAATAATPCSARNASRCASPPPWAATRAGWPSTCSSWA